MPDRPRRVLIIDSAPADHLLVEIAPLKAAGVQITLNLWRLEDREAVKQHLGDQVNYVDFNGFDEEALVRELTSGDQGYDAIKTRANVPITRRVLEAGARPGLQHRLRVVAQVGSGVNKIDLQAATHHGIKVTHTPGSNAESVAEHALALMLAATRGIVRHDRAAHMGQWPTPPVTLPPELSELTLGIVGPGLIGQALARKAKALGMTVIATGSNRFDDRRAEAIGLQHGGSLDALLAASDVVSLNCPLNEHTRGLIGAAELARMKPTAILLNLARGGVVDEHALAAALADGSAPPAVAAVDVFEHEHTEFESPLMGIENAILTPHVAGMTRSAARRAADQLSKNIVALLEDRKGSVPVANAQS